MDSPFVLIETSLGDILVELFPDKAPKTVKNFLDYVDAGHYDGTIFHRVVRGFVIQGGGFDISLQKKECRPPVLSEADNGLLNTKGTLAMARAPQKDSACDEFFINAADNPDLDHSGESDEEFGYCVFGRVEEGQDIVKKINWKIVKPQGDFDELPVETIIINSIKRFD